MTAYWTYAELLIAMGRDPSFSLSHTIEFLAQQNALLHLSLNFFASAVSNGRRYQLDSEKPPPVDQYSEVFK